MKKKNLKDNKGQSTKNKSRRKKELSLETQVNPPLSKIDVNQRLNKDPTAANLPENDATTKLEKSYTVKGYNSSIFLDYNKMNQTDYLNPNYYCIYCNISFPNKMKLQAHCLTDEHQSVIISDEGRDWKFRPPPRGILANEYSLCQNYSEKGICRFSDQCIQAHAKEELSEWKERFEYRSMKLEKAKERELHGASYADKLLEKLNTAQNIDMVLSEKIDGVTSSVSSDWNLCISQKPSNHTWTITLHCPYQIHAIALLYDSHRKHFSLTNITMIDSQKHIHKSFKLKDTQEWINTEVQPLENVNMEYKIEIYFETEIYGTFRQAVVVDFGSEPVLIQKFCVDIVPLDEFKELECARTTVITHSERWCKENTNIVSFKPVEKTTDDLFNNKLLDMYPAPTNKNVTLNQTSLEKHPTKNNYRIRMHDLLHYEEMAQFDLISHFNLKSYLHLSKSYMIMPYSVSVANYAWGEELYAKLDLSSEVSEDSPQGRLILNNCNSVFVTKTDCTDSASAAKDRTAYEAIVEAKTKKEIYIRLSSQTVKDLGLQPDIEAPLDIQFQLNRSPFCEMHYALDHLSTFDFLFPNIIPEPTIPWSPSIQWNETADIKLNLKQKEALVAITASVHLKLPPILIIGPFGTGKTFTLGQAISRVIQHPDTHILICTHSNSAADIYIRDYLHPQYEAGFLGAKPLRIYYHRRRVATVHSTVHKYCLFEPVLGGQKFAVPTKEHIMNHRIIVTTVSSSVSIAQLGIPKGHFTHILIDEAAQVMECATLIPLTLANAFTRIVLAGDYMQLSTEVFSPVCRERNLQTSLLERLYDLYPEDYPCKIMLVENYRSHPAIIKFTSTFFYEGRLKPRGKISAHPRYHPLTFFTAMGEDIQDANSTAFYNNSEVLEVCERVMEICKSWPVKLWGPLNQESVGVVSPYLDQVMRIRVELRKKRLYKINVERVLNVQGKEFRVVILSTVRTRHTCSGSDSSLDYGFLSNAKLLTTAITRAQSLVAVVGDPVSLCSLGKCRKLWEEFLRQCSEAGSLHGITWSSLRSQLDGIELRKIYGLNPLAQEFIPRYLLLSAVPHPMTLIPPGPPVQCFQYARPIAYSPNIIPTIPVSYPPNPQGFFPSSASFGAPLPAPKPVEVQKANPIGAYHALPYPSIANFYPNRAALLPFPPSPALASFPALAVPNLFPATATSTPPFHPGLVQHPTLGNYVASALPYQPKIGVFPQVIPARPPPPGFNNASPSTGSNFVDHGRAKASPQQHIMPQNVVPSSAPPPLSHSPHSPSPDKSIQYLNNVHFPKRRINTDNSNESFVEQRNDHHLQNEIEISSSPNPQEESIQQRHSESLIGEQFVKEISKLLSDQSPVKQSPKSTSNQRNYKSLNVFDRPESVYQSNSEIDQNHHSNSSTSRGSFSSRSFLTLQQVANSSYSNPASSSVGYSSIKSIDESAENGFNHANIDPSRIQASPNLSQGMSNSPQNILSDSLKWNSMGTPSPHQFSLTELFRSNTGGTSGSSIPLYLRKGTSTLNTNSNSQHSSHLADNNLGHSSGWNSETLRNEDLHHSQNASEANDFHLDPNLLSMRGRENSSNNGLQTHKQPLDQGGPDSKTYAGVLRSTLDPDFEQ